MLLLATLPVPVEVAVRIAFAALVMIATLAGHARPGTASQDESAVREVVATWYRELQKTTERAHWRLFAPGAIDGGPRETEINPGSRARSPTISNELAARALTFNYEVDVITIDPRFAKVIVWERGYFFAWAAQKTYESAASALFILEKQPDGRWLILGHEAHTIGIPPTKRTDPLPDLREHFYATQGKDRDPKADAESVQKF